MLYQFYETQRALLSPFAEFAAASSKLYSHPLSPFAHTPMADRVIHIKNGTVTAMETNEHPVPVERIEW